MNIKQTALILLLSVLIVLFLPIIKWDFCSYNVFAQENDIPNFEPTNLQNEAGAETPEFLSDIETTPEAESEKADTKSEMISETTTETNVEAPEMIFESDSEKTKEEIRKGALLSFGRYEQDNDFTNGPEKIQWQVLDVDEIDNKALLLSVYALEAKPYHNTAEPTDWFNSFIKTWLNSEFLSITFAPKEQDIIIPCNSFPNVKDKYDKVFLPGLEEMEKYFGAADTLICELTDYSRTKTDKAYADWWTRNFNDDNVKAWVVQSDGNLSWVNMNTDNIFVRPMIWIRLESLNFQEDTVEVPTDPSEGNEIEHPDYPPEPQELINNPLPPESNEMEFTETPIPTPTAILPTATPIEAQPKKQGTKPGGILAFCILFAAAGAGIFYLGHKGKFSAKKTGTVSGASYPPVRTLFSEESTTVVIVKEGAYVIAGCKGQGQRDYQEDALWFSGNVIAGEPVCAVIADGMGGMENGAASSKKTIEAIRSRVEHIQTNRDIPSRLWQICNAVNDEVYTMNSMQDMNGGSTLICIFIVDDQLYWISIGDSRIYLFRDGVLASVNEEHELENRMYKQLLDGEIDLSEIRETPNRNLRKLTSNIGRDTLPLIDQNFIPYRLQKGDKLLLCSDGVSGTLDEVELMKCLEDPHPEVNCDAIRNMVEEKNKKGQDNYSAIVVLVAAEAEQ